MLAFGAFDSGGTGYGDMPKSKLLLALIGIALPLFWLAALIYARVAPLRFSEFTNEDGPIENLQVIILLAGCVVGAAIARKLYCRNQKSWAFLYSLGTVGLFFVAGEELSWGQRIFHEQTPEWLMPYNLKHETNVHNLIGFSFVFGLLGTVIPILMASLSVVSTVLPRKILDQWNGHLWIPHPLLIPSALCSILNRVAKPVYFAIHPGITRAPYPYFQQEVGELIFYLLIVGFLLTVFARIKREKESQVTSDKKENNKNSFSAFLAS